MKRLYYYISAISVLVLGISGSVSAMIKFDVSATSGKVTETVSEWGGKAKKMMDENYTAWVKAYESFYGKPLVYGEK